MELRQLFSVLIFVVAAVVVKNAMPTQLPDSEKAEGVTYAVAAENHAATLLAAAVPVSEVPIRLKQAASYEVSSVPSVAVQDPSLGVPGSVIALVVSALGMVAVARRTIN